MTREEVSEVSKALSDSNRLKIIEMLVEGEKCGCRLLEELKVTQPTLSHHMKVLGECGLVISRKEGKWQHYSINCTRFQDFKNYISSLTCCDSGFPEKACGCTGKNKE